MCNAYLYASEMQAGFNESLFNKNNEVFHSILCILQENILLTLISNNSRSQRIDISEMNARLEARSEFIKRGMIKVINLLILPH